MRLTREDWIRAAYHAFESGGIERVQVVPLARSLRVSRGSFYWHFADHAELLDAVIEHWSRQSSWFRLESEHHGRPGERLEFLAEAFGAAAGQRADRSMMRWAQREPRIALRMTRVLKRRLGYIAELLHAHGLPAEEAAWRAQVISYAYMGWLDRTEPAAISKQGARDWMLRLTALALTPLTTKVIARRSRPLESRAGRPRRIK